MKNVDRLIDIDGVMFLLNTGWCFDQGMFDIGPYGDEPDYMPIVQNSNFIGNKNTYDPVGYGAISLVRDTYYAEE